MSAEEAPNPDQIIAAQTRLLNQMRVYCANVQCRHRALSEYFGQSYEKTNCQACDVCLNEAEGVEDATVAAQKILSCVFRVGQRFGVGYVTDVLNGANTEQIRARGHDRLSTYGLLDGLPRKTLMNYVYQLLDRGLLERTATDYPVLILNDASWEVLRGQRSVKLMRSKSKPVKKTRAAVESWKNVDEGLFERLRKVRRELAEARGVPAYVIFGDASLRDMARRKPTTGSAFLAVHGVGEKKLADFGEHFMRCIREHS